MKEFLLIFRRDISQAEIQPSPEQYQALAMKWQDWMSSMAAQNKIATPGKRLAIEGRVVTPNKTVTNGPYVELKEAVQGYMIIAADSIEEVAELAKGCPVLGYGGSVEVRPIISPDGK